LIQEHKLDPKDGWQLVKELPENSSQWTDADREWFIHLNEEGVEFVKIGDTMYHRKLH
jgi:hypothetical protein